ncbi:hypothetical protein GOV06_01265, partial [Candidatus Woesearchaeota archaeon]|nr:hypothetical protein [Candidatus Woesearchaeota archaeon]
NNQAFSEEQIKAVVKNIAGEIISPLLEKFDDYAGRLAETRPYKEDENKPNRQDENRPSRQKPSKDEAVQEEQPTEQARAEPAAEKADKAKAEVEKAKADKAKADKPEADEQPEADNAEEPAEEQERKIIPMVGKGINEFYKALDESKVLVSTLYVDVKKAYIEALDNRRVDGNVDYSIFKKADAREMLKKDLRDNLAGLASKYSNSESTDIFDVNRLMKGYLGFDMTYINNLVENNQDKLKLEFYEKEISEAIKPAIQTIKSTPILTLSKEDAQDVVNYTRTKGRIDPDKLEIGNMMGLLIMYRENGVITERELIGSDILAQGYDPEETLEQKVA